SPSFRHPMSRAHRDRHSFPTRRSSDLDFLQGESGSGTYTVLKVPHHGSDGAATEAFLEQNKAGYALISVGKDNPYGHPGEKLLKRLETCGIQTFCTKEDGAITLLVKGEIMTIRKFLE